MGKGVGVFCVFLVFLIVLDPIGVSKSRCSKYSKRPIILMVQLRLSIHRYVYANIGAVPLHPHMPATGHADRPGNQP